MDESSKRADGQAAAPAVRFVPTLTEVVEGAGKEPAPKREPADAPSLASAPASDALQAPQIGRLLRRPDAPAQPEAPPPYIPTLNAVVTDEPIPPPAPAQPAPAQPAPVQPAPLAMDWDKLELGNWISHADQAPSSPSPSKANTAPPAAPPQSAVAPAAYATAHIRALFPPDFEEQLVHRVVQRVDSLMAARIGEVIATVVERQTRALLPTIRKELEFAIRKSVYEAMADELNDIADQTPDTPL
ncbi:hypothetical protein [Allofranklinella schreckenbergeri]|uniref:hypothetical protein n=1 Tax=Allofranklinella schreckenbergeri TaxID=1076744 RepID=UPI001EEF7702|nr:hypothetical protein [Allofranklinella schreckenbergeri]